MMRLFQSTNFKIRDSFLPAVVRTRSIERPAIPRRGVTPYKLWPLHLEPLLTGRYSLWLFAIGLSLKKK